MLRPSDGDRWRRALGDVSLPRLGRMRPRLADDRVDDPRAAAYAALASTPAWARLPRGGRVAIAVGSRGLGAYAELVAGVVDAVREAGAAPLLVPAMGSHGGATPEGQARVLRDYGLADLGVPIEASMEVRDLGPGPEGAHLYVSAVAADADAVVLANRVKSHTSFRAQVESGLTKMLVVGLGKDAGAQSQHAAGYAGFGARLEAAREPILRAYPATVGVAVVENAHGEPALVEGVPPEAWARREPELLREAKARMPRLPFDALDVLVVQRAGKDVSGLGMDPNVTGRHPGAASEPPAPTRIALLSLTAASEGNANGMGLADVVPRRFADAVDPDATWINAVTSTNLAAARLPLVMPDEATAVRLALRTCGAAPEAARLAMIRDTGHLAEVWASAPLLQALGTSSAAEPAGELGFAADGSARVGDRVAFPAA